MTKHQALTAILGACGTGTVAVNGVDIGRECAAALAGQKDAMEVLRSIARVCQPGMFNLERVDIGAVAAAAIK